MTEIRSFRTGQRENHTRVEFGDYFIIVNHKPKRKVLKAIGSGDVDRADAGIASLIAEHNLRSDEGDPLPSSLTAADLDEVDMEVYFNVVKGVNEAIEGAPWFPRDTEGKAGESDGQNGDAN